MPIREAHGTTTWMCSKEKQQDQYEKRYVELMVVGHVEPGTERSMKRRVRELQSSAPPTHQLTVERKKQNTPQRVQGRERQNNSS